MEKDKMMTPEEEKQLLREVHENNIMLRSIVKYLNAQIATKDSKDFGLNLVANVIGNKIT
jgi:hypothetical protein